MIAIIAGEQISEVALGGLVLAVAGGVVVAVPSAQSKQGTDKGPSGAYLAAAAALLYGCGFWAQGRFSRFLRLAHSFQSGATMSWDR